MGRKNSNGRRIRRSISHPKGSGWQAINFFKTTDKYKDDVDKLFEEDREIMAKNKFYTITAPANVEEIKKGIPELDELVNASPETDRLPVGFFTDNDDELYYINNAKAIVEDFMKLMQCLDDKYEYVNARYVEAEHKKTDIEHNIEVEYENCYQTWIIARAFKYVLMERRDYKNALNLISILKELRGENKTVLKTVQKVIDKLNNEEKLRSNRIYCPRSSLNLPINRTFYSLTEDEQKMLMNNLKAGRRK